jgi:type VI secretion system secreted protein Hcp
VRDLHVTKATDKASVKLFVACCTGEHLKTATLVCRRSGKDHQEFFRVILTSVTVTDYQVAANEASVVPQEQVTFGFTRIELHYAPQNPDGSLGADIAGGWDLLANRKI